MWRGRLQVEIVPSTFWSLRLTIVSALSFSLDTSAMVCADAVSGNNAVTQSANASTVGTLHAEKFSGDLSDTVNFLLLGIFRQPGWCGQ